jgi:7-cyano-7-deazaguanine synthase
MAKQRSVVLLSGGLDSVANLFFTRQWDEPILAITADYGQKAAQKEIQASEKFCELWDVRHEILNLRWLAGGSALTDSSSIPSIQMNQLDDRELTQKTAKAVWVPNRNGVLANVAASFAEKLNCSRIVLGFNAEEAATFPDNTEMYLNKLTDAFTLSTSTKVQAFSYTTHWDKKKIVAELKKLAPEFPFQNVWSCYRGDETACGLCESCQRFARALSCQ